MKTFLFLAVLWTAAAASAGTAPADTVLSDPSAEPAWRLRGTERPLTARHGGLPPLLKPVAAVPAAAVWLVTRPPIMLMEFDERSGLSRRVIGWFTRDVQVINTRVAAYLGYETGFGVTVLGLRIHTDDWYSTGLANSFRFSYLDTGKNILETRWAGDLFGDVDFRTRTRWQRTPGRSWFGLGRGPEDEREYDFQIFLNELQLRHPLQGPLDVGLTLHSRATRLRAGDAAKPVEPVTLARAASNHYLGLELELLRDSRDAGEMSRHGSLARLTAGWNAARTGDDADYRHLTAEYQLHRPLFRDRILAARIFYEGVEADDLDRLPFSELRGLGGQYDLRGYARDRFRDAHLLAFSLEYRYPVTKLFQGRLFSDWGTAAHRFDALELDDLAWSLGLGVALDLGDDLFILQYARGDEGGHFFAGTSTPFGYQSRRKR